MGDSETMVGLIDEIKAEVSCRGRNLPENMFRCFWKMVENI